MRPSSDQYVVFKKGESLDPSRAQPHETAATKFLKEVERDPDLQLHDLSTGLTYTANEATAVKLAYFSQIPATELEVRSQDGSVNEPVQNLSRTLLDLQHSKRGGIFYPKEGLWAIRPPELNPEFDEELQAFDGMSNLTASAPSEAATVPATAETYPVRDYGDASTELLPGIDGDKILEVSVKFLQNAGQGTLLLLGGVLGIAAHKSMGFKGVIALTMAALALQRYLKMGSQIIHNQKLDLVARAIQEGIPVNASGQIDAELMEALRRFPAGDHNLRFRRLSPAIRAREWNTGNVVQNDPGSFRMVETSETIQQFMDWDTFVGEKGQYRLIGIDTPGVTQIDPGKSQAGAGKSGDRLRKLIAPGTKVRVEVATSQPALYGRMPCYLYAQDEQGREFCVNQRLLEEGLARVTNFQPCHPKIEAFIRAALEAISQRRGFWSALHNPAPKPSLLSVRAIKHAETLQHQGEPATLSLS